MYNYYGNADEQGDFGMSANEAINVLRNRPDIMMPEFQGNNGFEERYMRERMVELAFEGQRFWDVRRWKEGDKHFKSIVEMKIIRNSDGTYTYNRNTVRRQWDDKMYFFPIPQSERAKNSNLTQNPGW